MLRYSENAGFTSGVGTAGAYIYSANGCYDPNVTSTGHQPMGFDQMMTFYVAYTVLSSKISVVWHNQSAVLTAAVGISICSTASPFTAYERIVEAGNLVMTRLNPNTDKSIQKLTSGVNLRSFTGTNPLDSHDMAGTDANNPAFGTFFILYGWNPESLTTVPVSFQVIIEYDVVFTVPRVPLQS